jgi:AraC-like DNA-binding protein
MHGALPVAPALRRWVDAFWCFDAPGAPHRVLPDGCIDFLFDLRDGRATVVGPMSRAEVVAPPAGARLFAVRFQPGAAAVFVDAAAHELLDRDADLADVTAAPRHRLVERVLEAPDHAARCAVLSDFLLGTPGRRRPLDGRVERAAALLQRSHGALPIREVAAAVGVGERQLERLFQERVGLRPKLFARIARMQRAVALADAAPLSQAELARSTGYADEPHLLREVRALTGLLPAQLRAERHVGFVQDGAPPGTQRTRPEEHLGAPPWI